MSEKMMYDTILARSFSKHEQKKLGYGAFVACFLLVLSFCTVFKPYLGPLPVLNLRLSTVIPHKMLAVNDTSSSHKIVAVKNTSSSDSKMLTVNETTSSQKIIAVSDASSNHNKFLMVNETSSSHKIPVANDTSNSHKMQAVNDTSSIHKMQAVNDTSSSQKIIMASLPKKMELACNVMESRSDFCEISNGDIRIDGKSSTVYTASSQAGILAENTSWSIRPYARKGDMAAMSSVREWSIKSLASHQQIPSCTQYHSVPAILFSSGGYAGNNFHDFSDIVIPLYLTARQFNGEVQFLITDKQYFWIEKFQTLVKSLSRYDIIDIDREEGIHCFTNVIVGLKRHHGSKELTIDSSKSSYSMKDFRQFLRSTYSLKKVTAIKLRDGENRRPRLLIISRKRTRAFTNTGEIAKMARRLGFKVVVAEANMKVSKFAEIVNSCDVLLGVHGAGLTNSVFLPENAVLIQIVPFGHFEWLAKFDFGDPSKDMNLRYLDYNIKLEESTLIQQYPPEDEVLSNPTKIQKQGWLAFKSVYLEKQNVNLDVKRFRGTLVKALQLLHQ